MNLTDRDILMDLLIDAKYISTGYHQAVLESATDRVRNVLMQIHNEEMNSHQMVFDLMKNRGYYRVEPATRAGAAWQQAGAQGGAAGQQMGGTMGTAMGAMGMNTGGMAPGYGMGQQNLTPFQHNVPGQNFTGMQPGQ
ncbi:MAG: spore coat protein [Bacillota bacterium]